MIVTGTKKYKMAGRAPIKVYLYDKTGKFVNQFDNSKSFALAIGENTNYLSNNKGKSIGLTRNGFVFSKSKVGRESIKDFVRIQESPFVMKNNVKESPKVNVYNLKGEKVITFKNEYIARAVFPSFSYDRSGKKGAGLRFERAI